MAGTIFLLTRDLMVTSTLYPLQQGDDTRVQVCATADELSSAAKCATSPVMLVVDLQCNDVDVAALLESVRSQADMAMRVVGFGPHVQADRLKAAAAAGCDIVLTRGQLAGQLPRIWRDFQIGQHSRES